MRIITVNKPHQDENTIPSEVQVIDGIYPHVNWCVKTEMITEVDGGWIKWVNDKEEFCKKTEKIIGELNK